MSRKRETTQERMLNPIHIQAARFAQRHAMSRTCRNELAKRLFDGDGLVVKRDGVRMTPNEAFHGYLKRDLLPFVRDSFEAILLLGIVPIAFQRDKHSAIGENHMVPYVPVFGSYTIGTRAVDGKQRFYFYWGSHDYYQSNSPANIGQWQDVGVSGKRDDDVIIAHSFGSSPTINGDLVSNYALIAEQLGFIEELRARLLVAEKISCNPPMVSEYSESTTKTDDKITTGYYGVDRSGCDKQSEWTYSRNADQQAQLRRQMAIFEKDMQIDASMMLGIKSTADKKTRMFDTPYGGEVYMGAERRLAHQIMPTTRSDFVPIVEQAARIVCGIMGVPHTLFAASGGKNQSMAEAGNEAYARTVNEYVANLSDVATMAYQSTMGIIDLERELRVRTKHHRTKNILSATMPARLLLTEQDLLDAKKEVAIRISLDINPTTNLDGLLKLRGYGIIDKNTFGELMLRVNNLPRDLLAGKQSPLESDEQRQLILHGIGSMQKDANRESTDASPDKETTPDKQSSRPAKRARKTTTDK